MSSKGKLDIFVADSGIAEAVTLDNITEKHFDKTFGRCTCNFVHRAEGTSIHVQRLSVLIGFIAG